MMTKNWEILKYVVLLFLGWRVALLFITYIGLSNFANVDSSNQLIFPSPKLDYWSRWGNWDGGHFFGIAENGYLSIQTVFFPVYPLLIKLLRITGLPLLWSGFIVSQIFTVISLFYLFKLALLDFSEETAKKVVFALLIFPTSFYLSAVYSESVFLAFTLAAFYYARKERWLLAIILAGLTAATRLAGIVVIFAVAIEYFSKVKTIRIPQPSFFWETKLRRFLIYISLSLVILSRLQVFANSTQNWILGGTVATIMPWIIWTFWLVSILAIFEVVIPLIDFKKILSFTTVYFFLSLTPLSAYIIYQQIVFNSPFSFLMNELSWGRIPSFPWQPVLHYLAVLQTEKFFMVGNGARTLLDFLFFIFSVVILLIYFQKMRLSYLIYYFLSLIMPLFSGTLVAMPRYVLVIFPIFFFLAQIKNEMVLKIGTMVCILILAAYAMLFINGYWVT